MFILIVFQMFTSVRVVRLSNVNLTNQGLNKIFTDLCENLLKVRKFGAIRPNNADFITEIV